MFIILCDLICLEMEVNIKWKNISILYRIWNLIISQLNIKNIFVFDKTDFTVLQPYYMPSNCKIVWKRNWLYPIYHKLLTINDIKI